MKTRYDVKHLQICSSKLNLGEKKNINAYAFQKFVEFLKIFLKSKNQVDVWESSNLKKTKYEGNAVFGGNT